MSGQQVRQTDSLSSPFTCCCCWRQRPVGLSCVSQKEPPAEKKKTKTTKDPPLLVTTAWNCPNRPGVEQDRWSKHPHTHTKGKQMIPQSVPDTTPKPDPPTASGLNLPSPTKPSRKLPRRRSLRSNQVAPRPLFHRFHNLLLLNCKWRVWRVVERAVGPKHTMVTQPRERVATRFERCQKAAS